jgi:hypothetical protein
MREKGEAHRFGDQELILSHSKQLLLRVMVVGVAEKPGRDTTGQQPQCKWQQCKQMIRLRIIPLWVKGCKSQHEHSAAALPSAAEDKCRLQRL